jgi:cell division transport system permease protein
MKLLGATSGFIRIPFILEGIIYAGLGAFSAWIFTYMILWYFEPLLIIYLGEVAPMLIPVSWIFMIILLVTELILAAIIGSLGSYSAVRRYLSSE